MKTKFIMLVLAFFAVLAFVWFGIRPGHRPPLLKGIHATDYKLARSLGAQMLRLWDFQTCFLRGDQVEPKPNEWVDRSAELKEIQAAKLAPVGVLFTRQPWRVNSAGEPYFPWANEPSLAAADLNPWQAFVAEVVRRYKPWIRFWEIWNEPQFAAFWPQLADWRTRTVEQPRHYVECVRQAAYIIRNADAGIVIGGGGMQPGGTEVDRYLEAGLARYCDVLSIHYGYRGEADPAPQQEYILKVRRLKALSGGLPIWNTETNIGGMQPEAAALERLIKVNHEAGVEAVFYYYLDQGSPEHPENMADGNGGVKLWARAYGRFR